MTTPDPSRLLDTIEDHFHRVLIRYPLSRATLCRTPDKVRRVKPTDAKVRLCLDVPQDMRPRVPLNLCMLGQSLWSITIRVPQGFAPSAACE